MRRPSRRGILGLCLWTLIFSACGRDLGAARGVVEEFVDRHYVAFDLKKAKEYCIGLALKKINEEIRLTAGHTIDESTHKPRIYYKLLEAKEKEVRASFLFEGTIRTEDAPEFKRRWLVSAQKDGSQWRVSNFTEY